MVKITKKDKIILVIGFILSNIANLLFFLISKKTLNLDYVFMVIAFLVIIFVLSKTSKKIRNIIIQTALFRKDKIALMYLQNELTTQELCLHLHDHFSNKKFDMGYKIIKKLRLFRLISKTASLYGGISKFKAGNLGDEINKKTEIKLIKKGIFKRYPPYLAICFVLKTIWANQNQIHFDEIRRNFFTNFDASNKIDFQDIWYKTKDEFKFVEEIFDSGSTGYGGYSTLEFKLSRKGKKYLDQVCGI